MYNDRQWRILYCYSQNVKFDELSDYIAFKVCSYVNRWPVVSPPWIKPMQSETNIYQHYGIVRQRVLLMSSLVHFINVYMDVLLLSNCSRAGGQSSPSPSHLPTDNVWSVRSCWLNLLGVRMEQLPQTKFLPWPDLNLGPLLWQSSMLTTNCLKGFVAWKRTMSFR